MEMTDQDVIQTCEVHGFPLDPEQIEVVTAVVNQMLLSASQPAAQSEQAGWCYPEHGRTRFADMGDTVDATFADKMRAVYYAEPPSEFACEVAKIAAAPAAPAQSSLQYHPDERVSMKASEYEALLAAAAPAQSGEPVAQYQTKLRNPILPECDVWINVSEEGARTARENYSHVYQVRELFEHVAAPQPQPTSAVAMDEREVLEIAYQKYCGKSHRAESDTHEAMAFDFEAGWQARAASQQATATRTYSTQAGESVMGIALRQCGNEAEWRHILACNPKFAELLPSDYFPVGTLLTLPPIATATQPEQAKLAPAEAQEGMTLPKTLSPCIKCRTLNLYENLSWGICTKCYAAAQPASGDDQQLAQA